MLFEIFAPSGLSLGQYDERADCIRLKEGKEGKGRIKPIALGVGQETSVDYPIDNRVMECRVRRLPDASEQSPVVMPTVAIVPTAAVASELRNGGVDKAVWRRRRAGA